MTEQYTSQQLEEQLLTLIRAMKKAINSYDTEEYELLSLRFRNKMQEYFISPDKESIK